jgi:hypothetical protein
MTTKALQLASDLVSKDITVNIIYETTAELRRLDKLNKELVEITKSFIQLQEKSRSIIAKLGE